MRSTCRTEMGAVVLLGRIWGFRVAVPLAVAITVRAYWWWEGGTSVPTIDAPVPMPILLPPLLVIALTWTLVERWPEPMQVSARPPAFVRLRRYGSTLMLGSAAAFIASVSGPGLETVSLTAIGIAGAGLLAPFLGGWLWLPLVVAGYGWLQYGVTVFDGDYLAHDTSWAFAACILAALVYMSWTLVPRR
jgi:hypothetical protein